MLFYYKNRMRSTKKRKKKENQSKFWHNSWLMIEHDQTRIDEIN